MKINWLRKLKKNVYLQRGLLFLFLLLTCSDLVFPQGCCVETEDKTHHTVIPSYDSAHSISITAHTPNCQHSESDPSPLPPMDDDDCFCCCAHLIPTAHFSFHPALHIYLLPEARPDRLPNPPAFGFYRPPRFS